MIEADLVRYLRALPALSTFSQRIHVIQAPKSEIMPFAVIEVPSGKNGRTGQKTEERGTFRITVDCGIAQMTTGRELAETIWESLHEYRGVLGGTNDIYITCSVVRGWAGLSETYRFMVEGEYKAVKDLNSPT